MPLVVAQEVIHGPIIGICRVVGQNDEAMTSPAYTAGLCIALERIYRSDFWLTKARFAEARQRLNATASLASDWDSYGAEPPNVESRTTAAKVLDALEGASLSPSRLTPTAEGGIAVSFVAGTNRAVIEIYNTGEIAAATYSDEGEPAVWEPTSDALGAAIEKIRVHLAA